MAFCHLLSHLVHPVRVENAKATDLAPNAFLSNAPQVPCGLELRDTLAGGLSIDNTLHVAMQIRESEEPPERGSQLHGAAAYDIQQTLWTGRLRPPRRTRER